MKISFDYTDGIEKLKNQLESGVLDPKDKLHLEYKEVENYKYICDWMKCEFGEITAEDLLLKLVEDDTII